VYAITGGKAVSASEVAEAFTQALQKPVKYVAVGDEDAKNAMSQMGMDPWLVDNLVGFGQVFAAGWAGHVSQDVETLTGRKPISLQQFVNDFAFLFK